MATIDFWRRLWSPEARQADEARRHAVYEAEIAATEVRRLRDVERADAEGRIPGTDLLVPPPKKPSAYVAGIRQEIETWLKKANA